eukprot:4726261-Prymnesium_polylepis.1
MSIMAIGKGLLISEVRLESCGSGGAAFDHEGRLVAVNSHTQRKKAHMRMVSWLQPAHGLVCNAVWS